MSSNISISAAQLSKLVGLPDAPVIIDVRIPDDVAADPRGLPGSDSRSHGDVSVWAKAYAGQRVVVSCQRGLKLSEGVAAWLRHHGVSAENLAGGFEAWRDAGGLLLRSAALPPRDAAGRSVWVTRTRPKVDRIACPWLIRRFVDRHAVFLFVSPSEVAAVAERFAATPFDIEGVFWSHRGERCSFDVMIEEFGLASPALERLAAIVRAADTATLESVPEAAGFLAASLGLSRMFRDDLAQLDAGMLLYDAMYRWCRDASEETHNWPIGAATAKGPTS
ncbi:MAG: sulfurtransferase/chromate resistance protein [Bosea sp. (in: a-proteobacteria)]|uniref:sulfurtransferase/chromate resistance protein n=1 Tax=Bosea sp. (in: a-proteobacteria) TaxID=1871050 RepID=UPI002732E00A|nr:sulfurtransferase/chromate resistance protein [Bosea sp. (in: a-proteobacteria)]MDP3255370.1 sulfurtransferase/chromate resistance protein [Bosea sp. (in: a-proteobacteria)]MDP3320960.1 sulfurtransferase/chromate resistance protein [Bosea sp. (in: a-proteobacteria)]